ncbi:hypothetical protein AMI01nite_59610 [Aneurinibacillus migulanus]|nr:hypothetical protein AMI01nite_59610 [Aneurinibacillus migulanus]
MSHHEPDVAWLLAEVERCKKALREIRDHDAYSWNNDRQFIHSRINEVLK